MYCDITTRKPCYHTDNRAMHYASVRLRHSPCRLFVILCIKPLKCYHMSHYSVCTSAHCHGPTSTIRTKRHCHYFRILTLNYLTQTFEFRSYKDYMNCYKNTQFLPRDASAERGYEIAFVCLSVCPSVCLSVRLSVTIRYRDDIGWNSSKITSRPNSLRPLLWLTPTRSIWCNGNMGKFGGD